MKDTNAIEKAIIDKSKQEIAIIVVTLILSLEISTMHVAFTTSSIQTVN